ncbi:MAG: aldo/keto reductase [Candidatus Brocadiae bacterium]|nr:aldo/keto reductase [Candidatus Brocadiia bacterium]
MSADMNRRSFMQHGAVAVGGLAAGMAGNFVASAADEADIKKTRSYNAEMEYRRLGSTGLWVSAVCFGGHWKRVGQVTGQPIPGVSLPKTATAMAALRKNRYDVMTRCIERGINYVDACTEAEVSVYGPALKGRRDKMYFGFAMWPKCPRKAKWCKAEALLATLEEGMKLAQVDYVDVWRPVCSTPGKHSEADEQEFIKAFVKAKEQGKVRFAGVSSHGRLWLKRLCETYPEHFQALCFPYTANSKELPKDSLFDTVRKHDIGTFGIKPFGGGSLFRGAKTPDEMMKRARLAIRYILGNPAITAPIPGLASQDEVDNMAEAVKERRKLDTAEQAELDAVTQEMWATLPAEYEWLKDWEYV